MEQKVDSRSNCGKGSVDVEVETVQLLSVKQCKGGGESGASGSKQEVMKV